MSIPLGICFHMLYVDCILVTVTMSSLDPEVKAESSVVDNPSGGKIVKLTAEGKDCKNGLAWFLVT